MPTSALIDKTLILWADVGIGPYKQVIRQSDHRALPCGFSSFHFHVFVL